MAKHVILMTTQAHVRVVDSSLFLALDETDAIHCLDPMAAGIWNALKKPRSIDELVSLFASAFPDQLEPKIRDDLASALMMLYRARLICVRVEAERRG